MDYYRGYYCKIFDFLNTCINCERAFEMKVNFLFNVYSFFTTHALEYYWMFVKTAKNVMNMES